jgi:hypothetical protein
MFCPIEITRWLGVSELIKKRFLKSTRISKLKRKSKDAQTVGILKKLIKIVKKRYTAEEFEQIWESDGIWIPQNTLSCYAWISEFNEFLQQSSSDYFFLKLYEILDLAKTECSAELFLIMRDNPDFADLRNPETWKTIPHQYMGVRFQATRILECIRSLFSDDELFLLKYLRNREAHPQLSGYQVSSRHIGSSKTSRMMRANEYERFKRLVTKSRNEYEIDFREKIERQELALAFKRLEKLYLRLVKFDFPNFPSLTRE